MANQGSVPVFRQDPTMVLILGFVTCGLYLIWWNMKMAEVLNGVVGREMISPTIAVLSGCCMPLNVYFYYLCGEALGPLGERVGNPALKEKSTLLLILGIFFPMVAAMILQGHVNEMYGKQGS